MISTASRIKGSLFGMAYGDALAAPTEFMNVDGIVARYGQRGPQAPSAKVTDDTQMALAVCDALNLAGDYLTADGLEEELRYTFIQWAKSPENNRAPGATCMQACHNLARGGKWQDATMPDSKGCGANMRVTPVGLLLAESDDTRAAIAQFQAALTHGHPAALCASDLTQKAVQLLATGTGTGALLNALDGYALEQAGNYREDWLGDLWQKSGKYKSAAAFINTGWQTMFKTLDHIDAAMQNRNVTLDPCMQTGAGWVAEEAFATGLLCFLLFPLFPKSALRRAAVTSGDSDSIACLAGAFSGAYLGFSNETHGSCFPPEWEAKIEYRAELQTATDELVARLEGAK